MNVEAKLSKILSTGDTLVVKASDRDAVLTQISGKAAKYKAFDPETYKSLMVLRKQVKDTFDKGEKPGDYIMQQLWFLDPASKELVNKMTKEYGRVITPTDFKKIADIMTEHMGEEVPILKSFTRYFGRLAQDFLENAKPSDSAFDWSSIAKVTAFGSTGKKYYISPTVSRYFGLKPGEPITKAIFDRYLSKDLAMREIIFGVDSPKTRLTGAKFLDDFGGKGFELFKANKLPKSWTSVPSANFDGSIIEQVFTQTFEEKLNYFDDTGRKVTNILNVKQKSEIGFMDTMYNKSGKINDIADVTKARTAYGVNFNHANDSTIVRSFHRWGKERGIPTSTIHDAFMVNISDLRESTVALKGIMADMMDTNVIIATLDEMKARGLPKKLYTQYMDEAIDIGLIPIPGRSVIDGKVLTVDDILTKKDILEKVRDDFVEDKGFYGIGG